ncbi:MAG: hypothetical protein R3D59_15460 [Paracoccaceae bacterium]
MAFEEEQVQRLIAVIEKMVPEKLRPAGAERENRPEHDLLHPSRPLAFRLLGAEQYLADELGKFVDRPHFESLVPALGKIRAALSQMSGQGRASLRYYADLMETSSESEDLLKDFEEVAKRILDAAEEILEMKDGQKPPRANANWRAVSVFKTCAEIWEFRTGERAPTLNTETEHTSKFGLFVMTVFEDLGIGSTPRVAQDALARWRRDQDDMT